LPEKGGLPCDTDAETDLETLKQLSTLQAAQHARTNGLLPRQASALPAALQHP